MSKRQLTCAVIGVAVAGALAGVILATPAPGILSATVLSRAVFLDPVDLKFKVDGSGKEVIHVPLARETVIQQVVLGPSGQTGWHSHPGPAVVLVKAGELTLYSADDRTC